MATTTTKKKWSQRALIVESNRVQLLTYKYISKEKCFLLTRVQYISHCSIRQLQGSKILRNFTFNRYVTIILRLAISIRLALAELLNTMLANVRD